MYIKLNFTTNVNQKTLWRIVQDIIATSGTTSIAAYETRAEAAYHPDLKKVDYANSEIIRGVDPTGVVAQISCATTDDNAFVFHLRQEVYDNPGQYYYITVRAVGNYQDRTYMRISDSVTGNIETAANIGVNIANYDDFRGTAVTEVSPVYAQTSYLGYGGNFGSDIRSFKAYITDNCFIFSFNSEAIGVTGYTDTFNNTAHYSGPFMFMQYRRFDHHNNSGNGVIPMVFSNLDTSYTGFGRNEHWINSQNTRANGAGDDTMPFRAFNLIDAGHRIGSTYPIVYAPTCAMTVGMRSCEQRSVSYQNVDTSGVNDLSLRKIIDEQANYRHPTFDLNNSGYGLFPLGWSNLAYGNHGGNFTELNNVYIFNGEYQPGDELGIGEKVYTIWPGFYGYSNRFGIAIPKE